MVSRLKCPRSRIVLDSGFLSVTCRDQYTPEIDDLPGVPITRLETCPDFYHVTLLNDPHYLVQLEAIMQAHGYDRFSVEKCEQEGYVGILYERTI